MKAAAALTVYEQEVQKRCRQVMEDHIEDYGAALGIQPRLTNGEIEPVVWKPDHGADWRCVGVEIVRRGIPPGIRYWAAYCMLCWEDEGSAFYGYVGEWLGPRRMADDLHEKFQKLNPAVWHEGKEVGIYAELKLEEAAAFEEKLEGLIKQWIKLWKQAHGIKGALKA